MPKTKLCDTECPNEIMPHSTFTKQADKKKVNHKNVPTKYDVQSKINVHEIYRIINEGYIAT